MHKIPLHVQIMTALVLGIALGIVCMLSEVSQSWIVLYLKPVGTVFINALKMVAVPLILSSLISGIANLQNVSRLGSIGKKTILLYMLTTYLYGSFVGSYFGSFDTAGYHHS